MSLLFLLPWTGERKVLLLLSRIKASVVSSTIAPSNAPLPLRLCYRLSLTRVCIDVIMLGLRQNQAAAGPFSLR
jgi:hypothetical protein